MLFSISIASAACDPEILQAAATGLAAEAGPIEAGVAIAKACPTPGAWRTALLAPTQPEQDVGAAIAHPDAWARACDASLDVLPDGFSMPTPGERLALWSGCGLEARALMDAQEWLGASGPPLVAILAMERLEREGVPLSVRQPLIRALAGIPVTPRETDQVPDAMAADPFAAFRRKAPARALKVGEVPWPIETDPNSVCTVALDIAPDGRVAHREWVSCPEALRPYITAALDQSWFEAAKKNDRPVRGSVSLTFTPDQDSGEGSSRR